MTPERESWPPYAHVPGRTPHPESDPRGHSFSRPRPTPDRPDPNDGVACPVYARGLELFDAGYFWEAHVEFESLWVACGRTGAAADFFKALIKLSAAGVKHRQGRPSGVRSHAVRAVMLIDVLIAGAEGGVFFGQNLCRLRDLADRVATRGWPADPPSIDPRPADPSG